MGIRNKLKMAVCTVTAAGMLTLGGGCAATVTETASKTSYKKPKPRKVDSYKPKLSEQVFISEYDVASFGLAQKLYTIANPKKKLPRNFFMRFMALRPYSKVGRDINHNGVLDNKETTRILSVDGLPYRVEWSKLKRGASEKDGKPVHWSRIHKYNKDGSITIKYSKNFETLATYDKFKKYADKTGKTAKKQEKLLKKVTGAYDNYKKSLKKPQPNKIIKPPVPPKEKPRPAAAVKPRPRPVVKPRPRPRAQPRPQPRPEAKPRESPRPRPRT
jgi:hypothetical protein